MKELILGFLGPEAITMKAGREPVLEVTDLIFHKDSRTLGVELTLNFVMPKEEEIPLEHAIMERLPEISGVEFRYRYVEPAEEEEAALKKYLPHMIARANGEFASLTSCIDIEDVRTEGNVFRVKALGHIACDQLNAKVAGIFSRLIRQELGYDYRVQFVNDEDRYEEAQSELDARVRKEMEEILAAKPEPKGNGNNGEGSASAGNGTGENGSSFGGKKDGKAWRGRKRNLNVPAQGDILLGISPVNGPFTPIADLKPELKQATIAGTVFGKEAITIKSGSILMTLALSDRNSSISVKQFLEKEKWDELDKLIHAGDYVKITGHPELDRRDLDLTFFAEGIERGVQEKRQDNHEGLKRVELHCHTKMSDMDGLNEVEDVVKTAARWGQPAVAITDHGVVQGFPDAAKAAGKLAKDGKPIKIIYGMEGYVFDDADCHRPDGTIDYKKNPTYHIILLAATQAGMKNLYKLVSYSHLDYFYRRPRLPKSLITQYREGLIIGSACEAGEVFRAITSGASDEEVDRVASFYDYLEIQPLINNRFMIERGSVTGEEDLRNFNRRVLACGDRLGKMTCATTDAHYGEPDDAIFRNIIMAGRGFQDAENGQGLYMRTTDEMLAEFSYLGAERAQEVVVDNPNAIANMIDEGILPVPKGKFPPKIPHSEEILREACLKKAHSIYGDPLPPEIEERLNTELDSIIGNSYAVLYVAAKLLVEKSLADGYLVGSRGSVGSSFAATMAGITEVNPLNPHYLCPNCKHIEWGDMQLYDCGVDMPPKACPECGTEMKREGFTIPFATFLGFDGTKEPDIDLNFAGEYQPTIHRYVGNIFGDKNVFKAGTVSTVADKTAYGYARKFCEETGRKTNKYELDRLAKGCAGVKKTTGQHPGGIVICPEDHEIFEFCPVQHPANKDVDIVTTHYDYHKIDQNLLKLDLLGHNVPSMIRHLQDMTGIDPLTIDLADRKVLSIFNGIEALDIQEEDYPFHHGTFAIPEFGTSFVRQMLDDTKPERFADLVRISGFSHGTDVWLNNAQDYIRSGQATMREVISTRDDIMNYLILKGIENAQSFRIMEDVRKNRPLKEVDLETMKEHGVPQWYIDSCIKIQYMFPRAHAVAYTMMSFRMAWFKVYYPAQFYAAHLTSVADDFDAETVLKGKEACRSKLAELEEFLNKADKNETTTKQENAHDVLEVVYEAYARGMRFRAPELGLSRALHFTVDEDGAIVLPFVALPGIGPQAARAFADAYRQRPFDTIEDVVNRSKLNTAAVEKMKEYGVLKGLPETDQLSFFL